MIFVTLERNWAMSWSGDIMVTWKTTNQIIWFIYGFVPNHSRKSLTYPWTLGHAHLCEILFIQMRKTKEFENQSVEFIEEIYRPDWVWFLRPPPLIEFGAWAVWCASWCTASIANNSSLHRFKAFHFKLTAKNPTAKPQVWPHKINTGIHFGTPNVCEKRLTKIWDFSGPWP